MKKVQNFLRISFLTLISIQIHVQTLLLDQIAPSLTEVQLAEVVAAAEVEVEEVVEVEDVGEEIGEVEREVEREVKEDIEREVEE